MKKLLVIFACILLATAAFGQWDVIRGPVEFPSYSDAVALNATTILTIDDNIVRKTTNFGQDWTEILLPDGVDVNKIDAASETVAYICADDGLVFKTDNAGDTWTQVGDTANFVWDLESIDAYDENTVFIGADDGYFMKSTNSGTSWDTVYVADEDMDCGVVFTSLTNGVIAPDGNVGKVWHTTDGGDNWTEVVLSWPVGLISKRLYDVSGAKGTNTIALTGYHNVIWLSTDGGANFSVTGDYTYGYNRNTGIQVFNADSILAFTSDSQILTTIDGGTRWDTLSAGTGQSYQAHAYTSLDNGLLFANYGQEFSTTDGVGYVALNDWPGISFWGIAFPSDDKVMLGAWGGGELSLSTDGGASFSYPDNYVSETTDNIYELHFIDENTGLLGGGSGLLKKTTDGGATWVDIDNPMVQQTNKHIYAMHIASDGTIYAGGSSGIIMRSTNNGDTWEEVDNEASNTVYSITVLSNGLGFATMSRSTFAVSKTTALDSFKVVDPDFGYAVFRSVKERNGVVIVGGSDGVFRTTVDDLDTLYEVFTEPNDDDIYEVEFINDSTIYASGQNGIIYRSTDTGNTWEKMPSAAEDLGSTLSVLGYNGKKLFAAGQDGVVLSHEVLPAQADYTETFAGGAAELTWAENSTNANSGGVNLAVVADSAGLSNVGVYTDDENTGLLYAETDKALLNYELSSDIYIVKEQSDTEALYKGLVIKCDPEEQLFYRFIYRNASSDNGILKLQGFDGASWYISKSFYPGVDFDTLATGFHNFKAQVVGNNIWVYIDDQLLPGCPYTHDGEPVVKNGYAGIYKYTGGPATVAFDNFNIDVYNYAQYGVTAHVNMSVQMRKGNFTHAGHSLDIVGSFNGWGAGLPMTDADGDSIYSAFLGEFEEGTTLEFKCRRNGAWDNTEEFPYGGGNRSYTVLAEEDQDIPVFYYNDETVVSVDGIPDAFSLSQNYPNPFNPATTVKFALPKSETVTLSIFNVAGQKVAELINKQMDAGFYTVKFDARSLPSGVYIYRLGAGEFTAVRKMTLVK